MILLAAHGSNDRIIGFALADYFESIGYAYLDFIVTEAERRGRGLGGALYEALREDLVARGAKGLFFEVPTDDPAQVSNPAHLKANKARLKFYERYGALPIVGTLYDQPIRPGNPPEPRLLFDPLNHAKTLEAETLRQVIEMILTERYNFAPDDPYVHQVLGSVKDSPVRIRKPRYVSPNELRDKIPRRLHPLKVFCSPYHSLHHVRERGYVERPARVDVILKALGGAARRRAVAGPQLRREADPGRARHRLRQLSPQLLPGAAQGGDGLPLRLPDPPNRPPAARSQLAARAITASTRSRR